MKLIEVERSQPTLNEVIGQAKAELVVLRLADGSIFAVKRVDDFETEVELLKNNPEFCQLWRELSQEKAAISLHELKKELGV